MKTCKLCNVEKKLSDFKHKLSNFCHDCFIKNRRKKGQEIYQREKLNRIIFNCKKCNKIVDTSICAYRKRTTLLCRSCIASGSRNNNYHNGEFINSNGYRVIRVDGYDTKYRLEHLVVYERFLGRKLITEFGPQSEQVHHIDGDKLNNNIENLILCNGMKEHKMMEYQLLSVANELVKKNIIIFDKNSKKYSINEKAIGKLDFSSENP